jgi:hypothetical protein
MYQGHDDWASSSQRFATEKEASACGDELLSRWWVPDAHREIEVDEPVNYRFDFEKYESVPLDK